MGRKLFKIEGPNEKTYVMHGVKADGMVNKTGAKTVPRTRVIEKGSSKYETAHQGTREQQRRLKRMQKNGDDG